MSDMRDHPPSVFDLYEGLTDPERKFLSYEFALSRRIPSSRAFMRAVPYSLDEDTAAMVARIVERYVYPWPDLHIRYLILWVRNQLPPDQGIRELPVFEELLEGDYAAYFPHPEDLRDYRDGTDFTYGMAGIRDAEFEVECGDLQGMIAAAADGKLGYAISLPLPFGPPSLTRIPLVEGKWIDRRVVELAEWCAELTQEGYCRLPALDPHPLAWHRIYPSNTDWAAPHEANPATIAEVRQQTATRLKGYRGRIREVDGHSYIHFEDYNAWPSRMVPGDLMGQQTQGIVVETWNAWIDQESDDGWIDLYGHVMGKFDHPVSLREGRDYLVTSPTGFLRQKQLRFAAVAELTELACDRVIRTSPSDILTPLQLKIVDALRTTPWLTADDLAVAVSRDKTRLFQTGGLNELTRRDPPIVIKGPKPRGYALADVPPDIIGARLKLH